jgi:hypothetical protein
MNKKARCLIDPPHPECLTFAGLWLGVEGIRRAQGPLGQPSIHRFFGEGFDNHRAMSLFAIEQGCNLSWGVERF